MKTRAEIEQEMKEKSQKQDYLAEFKRVSKELTAEIKQKISKLKAYTPEYEVTHNLGSIEEVNALKSQISKLSKKINKLHIPKEVKVTKKVTQEMDLKNRTKKWLLIFSSVSLIVFSTGVFIASTGISIDKRPVNKEYYEQARREGRTEIYNALPRASQKFLDKKYPDKEKTFWFWGN